MRFQILGQPWDQPRGSEVLDDEDNALHVMAIDTTNTIAGVARLHCLDNDTAQIRCMAVAEAYQSAGVGSGMLGYLEQKAAEMGIKQIILDAREPAVAFYKKNNYAISAPSYLLFGQIPHWRMEKRLV